MNESLCEWLQVVCKDGIMAKRERKHSIDLNVGIYKCRAVIEYAL